MGGAPFVLAAASVLARWVSGISPSCVNAAAIAEANGSAAVADAPVDMAGADDGGVLAWPWRLATRPPTKGAGVLLMLGMVKTGSTL